ncbi:IS110 family transposase [Bradyrhizobium sp. JR3.5]
MENTADGYKTLLEWLGRHKVRRVGIEASGGYEQPVVVELRRKRFVVVVFQPAQVRAYAKYRGQRAKNDRIDAALIAACTAAVKKIHPAPDARLPPLAGHLTLIDQIGEDIARFKNRLESCRDARIQKLWKDDIARLAKRERVEFKALVAAIREQHDLARPARPDPQRRWGRAADCGRRPGPDARDRPGQPRAGCSTCGPCAV